MKINEIISNCDWRLNHHPEKSMKEQLLNLSKYVGDDNADIYGNGKYIANFEKEIADLFGKEAAVFMISGTMAQQIALRLWCEEKKIFNVAFHPLSHLEMAEHMAYNKLHGIVRVSFGAPEVLSNRLVTLADFKAIKEPIAAIVLELPLRLLAQLPSWEELLSISQWARENKIKIHLDGARIWESQIYLGKSLKEIAELFDSIYVSFYKGLNNLTGSALIGENSFIEKSKVWQRRHGGNLKTSFPYVISAKMALDQNLNRIPQYVERAKEISEIFNSSDKIHVTPFPVHTNMFNIIIDLDHKRVNSQHLLFAERHKVWLLNAGPFFVENQSKAEINIGENAMGKNIEEIREIIEKFISYLY